MNEKVKEKYGYLMLLDGIRGDGTNVDEFIAIVKGEYHIIRVAVAEAQGRTEGPAVDGIHRDRRRSRRHMPEVYLVHTRQAGINRIG